MKAEQKGERGFQMSDSPEGQATDLPAMNLVTLVMSLSTSALVHLGVAPPGGEAGQEAPPKNLPLARQTIDILEVLQEKTHGNLTPEEEKLFDDVLHDLHMRYVEATKA